MQAERAGQSARQRQRLRRAAGDGGAGAGQAWRRAGAGERHQRVQRERGVGGERVQPGGPGAVADRWSDLDGRGSRRDLGVGHAQEHGVGVGTVRGFVSAQWAGYRDAGGAERRCQSGSRPSAADDRQLAWGGVSICRGRSSSRIRNTGR